MPPAPGPLRLASTVPSLRLDIRGPFLDNSTAPRAGKGSTAAPLPL